MKKKILPFILFFPIALTTFFSCEKNKFFNSSATAYTNELVSLDSAENVALRFNPSAFFDADNKSNQSPFHSSLNGDNVIKNYVIINDSKKNPAIYIFNFANDNGFLFVSADYRLEPVLAFVERGNFRKDTVPAGIIEWANKTINNIEIIRKGLYDNTKLAKTAWQDYAKDNSLQLKSSGADNAVIPNSPPPPPPGNPCESDPDYYSSTTHTVGPFLPVTWGQDCSYNDQCPDKSCTDDCSTKAVTGCVATAMAQIIRYWQPVTSFNYNYASMPATYGNTQVQKLMHNAGVKVSMDYGCAINGGSSAQLNDVPGALKSWFGFTSADYSSYGSGSYLTVESNLNNSLPVILGGCNDETNVFLGIWYTYQNCHAWVCDGYKQIQASFCINGNLASEGYLYFHMNWGWHETSSNPPLNYSDYNGWFAYADWEPGNGENFQYANDMVANIHP